MLRPNANAALLLAEHPNILKVKYLPFSTLWNLSCSVGAVIFKTVCANVCNLLCNTSIMMDIPPVEVFSFFPLLVQ